MGLGTWDYDGSDAMLTMTNFGLEGLYKITDNAAIFVTYQGNKGAESSEDEDWNSSTVYIKMRLSLGAASKPNFADDNPIYGIQHAKFSDCA